MFPSRLRSACFHRRCSSSPRSTFEPLRWLHYLHREWNKRPCQLQSISRGWLWPTFNIINLTTSHRGKTAISRKVVGKTRLSVHLLFSGRSRPSDKGRWRGWGARRRSSRPWDKGGKGPFRPKLFRLKIKGGSGPPGPSPGFATVLFPLLLWVHFTPSLGIISHHKRNNRPFQGIFLFFFFLHLMAWTSQKKSVNSAKKMHFKLVKLLTLKVIC